MSDLQLALLMLGVLIIIAVVFFNWWQERNLRVEAENRFQSPDRDILMDDLEPGKANRVTGAAQQYEASEYKSHVSDDVAASDEDMPVASEASAAPLAVASGAATYAERVEPTFSDGWLDEVQDEDTDKPNSTLLSEPATEPAYSPAVTPEVVNSSNSTTTSSSQQEDLIALPDSVNQQIDLIALLYLSQPANGMALREFLLSLVDIDKPIYAYGLDQTGHWQLLTREQENTQFIRAICNIQLADRSGPISKATLSRFQQAVDNMGAELAAQIEWVGSADPLRYASELDQFCMEVDKMVGFHLIQGESGPFTGTKFRGLAEAGGLVLHEDGNFYYESDPGRNEFSLVNQDQVPFSLEMLRTSVIRGVTFQLDIPRVRGCLEAFNHMVLTARQMENSLNAKLIDDNHRPLGDTQIEKIRQQLKMIHAKMVARGIVPGSDNALRLFS